MRMLKTAVVSFVSSEKAFDCDLSAFIFRNVSPDDKVFAVVGVQSRVDKLLRHFSRSDVHDPEGRLCVCGD